MANAKASEKDILAVIGRTFKKDPALVSRDAQLMRDLSAKSMNLLELAAVLEAEFSVELPMQEIMKAKTAGDVVDLVTAAK